MNIQKGEVVQITPVYGFGWMVSETNKPMPVPKPLSVRINYHCEADQGTYIIGEVCDETHALKNSFLLLSVRARDSDTISWNVRVCEDMRAAREIIEGKGKAPVCTGFAETRMS